jgi:SAM-dependent methyltransferase
VNRYFFRDLRCRLENSAARVIRRLAFEKTMLHCDRLLWTPEGRRFVELSLLVEGYLLNRLGENAELGADVASQLLNVLKRCDTITYNEPGAADAYALLHFLDRYHRFQLTYAHLHLNGLMPLKGTGIDLLDVGTGPGPSMFAASDFYSERFGQADVLNSDQRRPAFKIDYAERSVEFRRWLHHFTEYANFYSPTSKRWDVPYHHGTFHDFSNIEFDQELSDWGPDEDGGGDHVHYVRRHHYDLITFSNFLTTGDQVTQFRDELQNCARFLRHKGILLVVGATDASAKYKEVYDALSRVIIGQRYGSRKFAAWCQSVHLEPYVLSYRWTDPYGEQLKQLLRTVYKVLRSTHLEAIPAEAAQRLQASIQPDYDRANEWQVLVFRKQARPRRAGRATS